MKLPHTAIDLPICRERDVHLFLLREDLNHPIIQGNKFRKLKYNLLDAIQRKKKGLISIGGLYSNHLTALSYAAHEFGLRTVGLVPFHHGEPHSPSMDFCRKYGMEIRSISRSDYQQKNEAPFASYWENEYPDYLFLPEGGSNRLAIQGCSEILTDAQLDSDFIAVAMGTGGTAAGVISALKAKQTALIFPAIKGEDISGLLQNLLNQYAIQSSGSWKIINGYQGAGFARVSPDLFRFIVSFFESTGILTDPIYTSKMMMGLLDCIANGQFPPGSRITAIHSGGIQSWLGFPDFVRENPKLFTHQDSFWPG